MTEVRADRLRNDELILQAAASLLRHNPGATVSAIADEAGLARPTVYRRYPDRGALITRLRTQVEHEVFEALDALPPWSAGTAVMTELINALSVVAIRYPLALLRYAPVPGSPAIVDARIAGLLAQGQQAGILRADIDAVTLNAALFGVLASVVEPVPPAAGPDQTAAIVLSLLLTGFTSTKGSP